MFRLALRTLRFRKGGFAATFIALFFGGSLVMACGGLMETGIRGEVAPQRLAAAQLVITGNQTYQLPKQNPDEPEEDSESATLVERVRLDRTMMDTVRAVPGVAAAVGDVSFPVGVPGGPALTQGHPWAPALYSITEGAPPAGLGEVVLGGSLGGAGVGDRMDLLVQGQIEHVAVTGLTAAGQPEVFFSDADTRRFAERLDAIGVIAEPGADLGQLRERISSALREEPVTILAGSERGIAEFPEVLRSNENLIVLAAVIGGFSIMVAMFVVASTLGLSIQHRYRELALLRAIGTTPRQLRRMVLGETLVVAVAATGLAVVPGVLLGGWVFDRLAGLGVVPGVVEFHQGPIPMVVGVGSGLLTALAAGFVAARRAGSTRPTEALMDASVQRRWLRPWRVILAMLCFGGGLALAIVTMTVFDGPIAASTAGPSVMLWAVGLAMIAPGLTKVMTAVLRWPLRALTGMSGHLAMVNARARTVRLAAAVTPIMLATGIATANLYLQTTQASAATEAFERGLRADAVLSSPTGFAPGVVDSVRTVPGVAGASELVTSTGFVERPDDDGQGGDGWALQGVSADGVAATTAVEVTAGRLSDLRGSSVAIPEGSLGRGVGDMITLRLGDRAAVDLRVVAVFAGTPGYERMLLPAPLLAAHTSGGLAEQILVRAAPGVPVSDLAGALTSRLALPGVTVADRATVTAAYAEDQSMQASVNYLLVGMIIAYTAISVANTLVMATGRRRREFGLQRLIGSTRGQVLRMAAVEAVLVAGIGITLGTLVSTTTLVPFSLVVTDSPMPSGPLWIYLSVIGTATLLTLAATLIPTWLATRPRPVTTVGPE